MKNYKKKVLTGVLVATTLLSAAGGAAALVFDVPAAQAQTISTNAVADETSNRSITLWKYAIKDSSELGDPGTGIKDDSVDKDPLAGIKFLVQLVEPIGTASLTDPLVNKEGTDYTIISNAVVPAAGVTITTGADGSVKLDLGVGTAVDGIYLITELEDDRGVEPKVAKPADPFFVYVPQTKRDDNSSLIYDVVVQPKNILESLLEPDKTVEEGKGYSIKAGQTFTWEATANVPSGLYTVASQDMVITPVYDKDGNEIADISVSAGDEIYADYFTMSDELVKELLLDDVKLQVKTDSGSWTDLVIGTDYEITVNGTAKTSHPVADSTVGATKAVEVSLTQAGMKHVATNDYTKIRVVYTTHTDVDFNGVIVNEFDVSFLTPGLKPVTVPSEENPESFNGGFDIEKTDEAGANLSDAVFHLAVSKADADAGIFLAVNGKTYGSGDVATAEAAAQADGTTLMKATSDSNGKAVFNGLKLDWFTDTNGNGQQDEDEPTWAHADIKKTYWIVETTSPEGYELLKAPQEVEVTLTTHNNADPEITVINKAQTKLPFTGGTGTTMLVVFAVGAITLGTVAIAVDKKRRQA